MEMEHEDHLLLQMRGVSFSFDRHPLLLRVDLQVLPGRIVGVAGGNGSGKSTLLKLAADLLTPQEGTIGRWAPGGLSPVSYCLTLEQIPGWMSAKELTAYYRHFFGDFDPGQAEELLESLKIPRKRPVYRLSTGQATLLALSLGLSRRAGLYLSDEPLSGIEPALRREIRRFLLRCMPEGSSLLMATHQLDELQFQLDELIILHGQKVEQIETETIRQVYGLSVEDYFLKETKGGSV